MPAGNGTFSEVDGRLAVGAVVRRKDLRRRDGLHSFTPLPPSTGTPMTWIEMRNTPITRIRKLTPPRNDSATKRRRVRRRAGVPRAITASTKRKMSQSNVKPLPQRASPCRVVSTTIASTTTPSGSA